MSRLFLSAVLLANLAISIGNALAGRAIFETYFGRSHSSDQLKRQGNGNPSRVDYVISEGDVS